MAKIYCLGDSLSENSYEAKLATLTGITTVSLGVGGDRTDQMLARVQSQVIDQGDASYCVVMGGVNDIYQAIAVSTIESNLQSIYTALSAAYIKVIACTIMPWNGSETDVNIVNTWIKSTAINIDYIIDTFLAVDDPANTGNLLPAYDSGDHTHLSVAGYDQVAQVIYEGMNLDEITGPLPTFLRI